MLNLLDEFDKSGGYSHAYLTTYDFNPGFFEDRILRTSSLRNCPNIAIFIDENKYQEICKNPSGGRQINRRYMLIPVKMLNASGGVFHPKLFLFAGKDKACLFIGSANLTRSGVTSNLEMISMVNYDRGQQSNKLTSLFKSSQEFLDKIIQEHCFYSDTLSQSFRQMSILAPVFSENQPNDEDVKFVHNLQHPILNQFLDTSALSSAKIKIIGPYFDNKIGDILDFLSKKINLTQIEIYIQQNTNTLNIESLKKWLNKSKQSLEVYKILLVGRKLHAKLLLLESNRKKTALVGSANFTSPALMQNSNLGNIELCLMMNGTMAETVYKACEEKILECEKITIEDVRSLPVNGERPCFDNPVRLYHAEYYSASLTIKAHCKFEQDVLDHKSVIKMLVKKIDSEYPDEVLDVSSRDDKNGICEFELDNHSTSFLNQSVNVCIIVSNSEKEYASNYVWLLNVAEINLSIDKNNKKIIRQFRDSGKGLVEFINNYIEQGMIDKAISLLENLTIKFDSGGRNKLTHPVLRRSHSPITEDDIPRDIWKISANQRHKMSYAMSDFIIRHYENVLKKHLRNPNLNGIENFLNVLETCANVGISAIQNDVLDRSKVHSWLLSGFDMYVGNSLREGYFRELWCKYYEIKDRLRDAFIKKNVMERIVVLFLALKNVDPSKDKNQSGFITIGELYEYNSKEHIKHFYEFVGVESINIDVIEDIIENTYGENPIFRIRFAK